MCDHLLGESIQNTLHIKRSCLIRLINLCRQSLTRQLWKEREPSAAIASREGERPILQEYSASDRLVRAKSEICGLCFQYK